MEHFNKLTPAQAERLAILIEDCAEVQQIACKILRHGYESYNPDDPEKGTNRHQLEVELGQLTYIVDRLWRVGDTDSRVIVAASKLRADTITRYTHHQ